MDVVETGFIFVTNRSAFCCEYRIDPQIITLTLLHYLQQLHPATVLQPIPQFIYAEFPDR
jgi:hypothetical protein